MPGCLELENERPGKSDTGTGLTPHIKGQHRSGFWFCDPKGKKISLNVANTVLPGTASDFHTVANVSFLVSPVDKLVHPWQRYRDVASTTRSCCLPTPLGPLKQCSGCLYGRWEEKSTLEGNRTIELNFYSWKSLQLCRITLRCSEGKTHQFFEK